MPRRATRATRDTPNPGRRLFEEIRRAYTTYVAFHSDHYAAEAGTIALVTMYTWLFDAFAFAVYVLISAPTSEAGKSRIFDVGQILVREPLVCADPTAPGLFHAIDALHPTLLIDEADETHLHANLRAVFNAGFQPGTPILRAKQLYDVFCSKWYAGIGMPIDKATRSRCIEFPMRRKSRRERLPRFHPDDAREEFGHLRGELQMWALTNREKLRRARPDMPEELSDRMQDAWGPLLAVADEIGIGDEAREWAIDLFQAVPKAADPGVQILHDVQRVLDDWPSSRIPTKVLCELRNQLQERQYDENLSSNQLVARLLSFGIHPEKSPFRMGGREAPTQRGYQVRRGAEYTAPWKDAFERYP